MQNSEQTKVQNFELDKFVEVAGVKIRYRERMGEAPPIFFLHGITESLEFWVQQLEAGIRRPSPYCPGPAWPWSVRRRRATL